MFVREDVEQRLLDRMEGAVAAAWRAALAAIAEGAEPEHARAAIAALRPDLPERA